MKKKIMKTFRTRAKLIFKEKQRANVLKVLTYSTVLHWYNRKRDLVTNSKIIVQLREPFTFSGAARV